MGDGDRVDEDDGQDLLEGDRDHRQVMPAEPQRRNAEPCAGRGGERHAPKEAEPEGQVIIGAAEADRIGAQREECSLCEIDLAAEAEHDRQAEDRDRVCRRLHQDVGDIAVGLDARRERNHRDRRQSVEDLSDGEGARTAHAFSATRSPKMPCGRRARKQMSTRNAKASLNGTEI